MCPYGIITNNEPGKYELACYSRNAHAGAPEPQAARPGARAGRARARGNRACRVQWRRQPWWASAWSRRWATARTASRRLCQPLRAGSSDRATARPRICKRATAHRQPAAAPRGWSADERRGRPAARFDRPSFGRQGRRQGRLRRTSRLLRTAAGARRWGRRATAAASTARRGWRGRCQPRSATAAAAALAVGTPPR